GLRAEGALLPAELFLGVPVQREVLQHGPRLLNPFPRHRHPRKDAAGTPRGRAPLRRRAPGSSPRWQPCVATLHVVSSVSVSPPSSGWLPFRGPRSDTDRMTSLKLHAANPRKSTRGLVQVMVIVCYKGLSGTGQKSLQTVTPSLRTFT